MSSRQVVLAELPWPSTALVSEAVLRLRGGAATITLEADVDGARQGAELVFAGVRAHAHRAEGVCTAWHVRHAYDAVVEVMDSSWCRQIQDLDRERGHDVGQLHHFMVYIDSHGAFEAIARSWQLRRTT